MGLGWREYYRMTGNIRGISALLFLVLAGLPTYIWLTESHI
jgi:hypothetical protein